MPDKIEFSPHLKMLPEHAAIAGTFLGQAHIAGTGPCGKTCRECAFWGVLKKGEIYPPSRFAKSNKEFAGLMRKGGCHKPMRNKSKRRFPHDAAACRLFEQNTNPPPVKETPDA